MKYDKPLIAGLIGGFSTIPGEILTQALIYAGIGKYSIYELDSLLITSNRPSIILGLIVNLIAGGTIGILFYYALRILGKDYPIYKGLGIGLLSWGVFELIFTATIEGRLIELRPMSDYYIHILATSLYGISLGYLFNNYLLNHSNTTANKYSISNAIGAIPQPAVKHLEKSEDKEKTDYDDPL